MPNTDTDDKYANNQIPFGRPSIYSPAIAEEIAERITNGELLIDICELEHMPSKATVFRWLEAREDFRDLYTRARKRQMHVFADQLIKRGLDESRDYYVDSKGQRHSDNTAVQRDKLSTGNMMWLMERLEERYQLKNNLSVNVAIAPAFNVLPVASATPIEHQPSEPVTVTQVIDNKEGK